MSTPTIAELEAAVAATQAAFDAAPPNERHDADTAARRARAALRQAREVAVPETERAEAMLETAFAHYDAADPRADVTHVIAIGHAALSLRRARAAAADAVAKPKKGKAA